jgi:hypothetical protein
MNDAQSNANRSESIGKLAAALSKFQSEVENPTKDSQGHNYKYADLANILNAVKQPLTNNKLSVCQMLGSSAQGISVTTILMHESGEYIESDVSSTTSWRCDYIRQEICLSRLPWYRTAG